MGVYVGTEQESMVLRTVQTDFESCFKLHGFSEASNVDLCAAIYVLEFINTKLVSHHLLASKSRITKGKVYQDWN